MAAGLAQTLGAAGDALPMSTIRRCCARLFAAVGALRARGHARVPRPQRRRRCGHGVRDGVRRAPWRQPQRRPVVTEGDGIADSRADFGDSKELGRPGRRAAQRPDAAALFNEEPGVVIQVAAADRDTVFGDCARHGLAASAMSSAAQRARRWSRSGATPRRCSRCLCATCTRSGTRSAGGSPACATTPTARTAEHAAAGAGDDPGLHVHLTFDAAERVAAPSSTGPAEVAILREQGVNNQVEMAAAMARAGFDAYDVHMSDLQAGRARLDDYVGFVACGGFSYGDTLGAGEGWAARSCSTTGADQFAAFFARSDSFALGVCNGLPDDGRAGDDDPRRAGLAALHAQPQRAVRGRLSLVEIVDSPSLFFAGYGRQPPADRGGPRRGFATSRSAATRLRCTRRCASSTTTARRPRPTLQPERQPGRPDGGDDGRRPVHGADAAPGAGVPQRTVQLDAGRRRAAQPMAAHVRQRPALGRLSAPR